MTSIILTQTDQIVKWATAPTILIIRTFDKKGEWMIEALFEGGAKVTGVANTDFITALESDLSDQGWQIDASLFHGGFNAKPPTQWPGEAIEDELMFASSAGLWPDDYSLCEPTL